MASRIPYRRDPDFSRPLLEIDEAVREHMCERLEFLYGREVAEEWMPELERILRVHHAHKPPELIEQEAALDPAERFTERDLILITYADAVRSRDSSGIEALHRRSAPKASCRCIRPHPHRPGPAGGPHHRDS